MHTYIPSTVTDILSWLPFLSSQVNVTTPLVSGLGTKIIIAVRLPRFVPGTVSRSIKQTEETSESVKSRQGLWLGVTKPLNNNVSPLITKPIEYESVA